MSNKIIVYCTIASDEEGRQLARTLIGEQLAACVSLLPGVTSIYPWDGAVEESQEVLLMIKTTQPRWNALRERILQLHAYAVPELLATPVLDGNPRYLDWIDSSTAEL
jgi:periplasmic divalent cation tolerance protein